MEAIFTANFAKFHYFVWAISIHISTYHGKAPANIV